MQISAVAVLQSAHEDGVILTCLDVTSTPVRSLPPGRNHHVNIPSSATHYRKKVATIQPSVLWLLQ